ncbi:RNA polymerase sigma factor [Panacibacter ginsenosidivorans]|uniref:RNA polymerase sigma factor n=1 Tax=Panacibacter ginsenosidivorans TaxID=1813871 RepID=A0A5B8VFY7_9BACT|nr:RNA polymerase sigma factor [Panacibacter ginsenosidivorans]QEC70001.1 RNA polymerase sigma factor [Panacibacter ginsenosidivorans]
MRIIPINTKIEHYEPEVLKQIIRGCKRFDQRSQKAFYEKFYGFALKVVFRYIYRYDRSIDTVNDGFVKIFKNIGTFECNNDKDFEKILFGWIRRIMVNTAIDELRRNNMMPEIGGMPDHIWDEPDKSTAADQLLLYKELVNEIKKLPPSYRAVFNMFVIDGLSHQEIAAVLGISTGTSKSSLSKARAQLQKILQKNSAQAAYAANK